MFAGLNIFHVGFFFVFFYYSTCFFPPCYKDTRRISHFFLLEVGTFLILQNVEEPEQGYTVAALGLSERLSEKRGPLSC